jgi:small subunit ribosomal protein S16
MAVRIRLSRVGSAKNPIYRIVVADAASPRDGRFIENLGQYNPRTQPSVIEIDTDRASAWLQKGAQPTRTVKRLLAVKGVKA